MHSPTFVFLNYLPYCFLTFFLFSRQYCELCSDLSSLRISCLSYPMCVHRKNKKTALSGIRSLPQSDPTCTSSCIFLLFFCSAHDTVVTLLYFFTKFDCIFLPLPVSSFTLNVLFCDPYPFFLSRENSFRELLPPYWQYCVFHWVRRWRACLDSSPGFHSCLFCLHVIESFLSLLGESQSLCKLLSFLLLCSLISSLTIFTSVLSLQPHWRDCDIPPIC